MPNPLLIINDWSAGMIDDETAQASNGFQFGVGVDIHDRPGFLRPSYKAAAQTGIDGLVTAFSVFDGDGTEKLYAYDGAKIFKSSGGAFSTARTLSGVTALTDTPDMVLWDGCLWYSSKTDVGRLSATTFDDDYLTTVLSGTLPAEQAGWKPLCPYLDSYLLVGDGRYVSRLIEPATASGEFNQKALTLPEGYIIRCMEVVGDRVYIGCGGGDATDGDPKLSVVFVWDGTSENIERRIDVDCVGGIQGLKNIDNTLYLFARNISPPQPAGIDIYYFNGADFEKLKTIPCSPGETDSARTYANASANYNNDLLLGTTRAGGGTSQIHGVWKYGKYNRNFQRSLVLDNLIPAGTESDITIGAIAVWGDKYAFSSKTGASTYAVNYLTNTTVNTTGFIESQVYELTNEDYGNLVKGVKVFANTLASGVSVAIKYDIDNAGSWTSLGTVTSANQETIIYGIYKLAQTIQIRLEFTPNGTNYPEIYKLAIY